MTTRYGARDGTWTRTPKTHAPQTCLSASSSTLATARVIIPKRRDRVNTFLFYFLFFYFSAHFPPKKARLNAIKYGYKHTVTGLLPEKIWKISDGINKWCRGILSWPDLFLPVLNRLGSDRIILYRQNRPANKPAGIDGVDPDPMRWDRKWWDGIGIRLDDWLGLDYIRLDWVSGADKVWLAKIGWSEITFGLKPPLAF